MEQSVSKSAFKAKALELFREVERSGRELIITDHGKPVLKIVPYARDPMESPQGASRLGHSVRRSVGARRLS